MPVSINGMRIAVDLRAAALRLFGAALIVMIAGCAATRPAPVTDRTPPVDPRTAAKPAPVPPVATSPGVPSGTPSNVPLYTVRQGDTLFSIAKANNIEVRDLAAWNNIDSTSIRVGQQLRLGPPDGVVTSPVRPGMGAVETRPIDGAPPVAADPNTKTGPVAVLVPYSDQAYAQMTKPQTGAKPDSKPDAKPDTPRAEGDLDWAWPATGKVTGGFNDGTSKGITINGKMGQPVLASAGGRVIFSGTGIRGLGKLVVIRHNAQYLSVYAHNNNLLVKEGQNVTKGQRIAEMGNSDADQVKLHFEIRRQGKPVDPMKFLPQQ